MTFDKRSALIGAPKGIKYSDLTKEQKAKEIQDLTDRLKAGDLLKFVTAQVDGKGGGRADMAQGAAGSTVNLAAALDSVYDWVSDAS